MPHVPHLKKYVDYSSIIIRYKQSSTYIFVEQLLNLFFFHLIVKLIDQVRDQTLSRIKSNIELMVATNGGNKAVIIPHSMGVLYFLHFMKWVEAPAPMGGGGGQRSTSD